MRKILILAAPILAISTLAAGALAGPALAAPADDSVVVPIGDLDLASEAGTERLQRRLRQAANHLCGRVAIAPARIREAVRDCQETALESADRQIALAAARARTDIRLARRQR